MTNNLSNLSLVNKPKNKLFTLVLMQLKNKLDKLFVIINYPHYLQ